MGKRVAVGAALALIAAVTVAASGLTEEEFWPDTAGVSYVEIHAGAFSVEVVPGQTAEVALDSPLSSEFPWDEVPLSRLREEREGPRLYAWVEGDGRSSTDDSARVLVRLPPGSSLDVTTTSGSVSVRGIEGGTCRVRTASGSIVLRSARCRARADSISGDIEIDSTFGAVQARTVSGRIDGVRVALLDDSDFSSVSGRIDVSLVRDVEDYEFDLKSVSGLITVGAISADRGLRMGFGRTRVRGRTISGALIFSAASSRSAERP